MNGTKLRKRICLYCANAFVVRSESLVCAKCEKDGASMVHVAPALFSDGPAGTESRRAVAVSKMNRHHLKKRR